MNNKDEKGLQELIQAFIDEERRVLRELTNSRLSLSEYRKRVQQTVNGSVKLLCGKTLDYSKRELPAAFKEGQNKTDGARDGQPGSGTPPCNMAKEANAVLSSVGFKYSGKAFSYDTYIEIQHATEAAGKDLLKRVNGVIERLAETDEDTIYNVTEAIKEDIGKNGLLNVEYSNGARVPIDKYAAMAARSARIESANIGAFGRAIENGTDYVKCTEIYPTCEICAKYQGRTYCISGKDRRFPALFETALRHGYALIHPNCRHEFIPVWLELLDDEELKREIAKSQIKDKDPRSVEERNAYARWQEANRAYNAEKLYFERAKNAMGKDFPYSDIGAFRRSYRAKAGSNAYNKSHNLISDYQQFQRQRNVLGDKGVNSFAKYREIKYNDERRFDLLRQYRQSVESGKVDNVGFEKFEEVLKEANERIVGVTTSTGARVEGISYHLIERIIGNEKEKRLGVSIDTVIDTLKNGDCDSKIIENASGQRSIKFVTAKAVVSFNPDTHKVVQCIPKTRG